MIDTGEICGALCHVLGNTCRIYRTTRSYEWNVSGPGAELARTCFHDQGNDLSRAISAIADQILGLGGAPILDYSDAVVKIDPPTHWDIPSQSEMIVNLRDGHQQANFSVNAALDLVREVDELATLHFLTRQITLHRLHRYRLGLLQQ